MDKKKKSGRKKKTTRKKLEKTTTRKSGKYSERKTKLAHYGEKNFPKILIQSCSKTRFLFVLLASYEQVR